MALDRYDCSFEACTDGSLQIMVTDRRHNRKFCNLFTKHKLEALHLRYTVNELCSILQTARDGHLHNDTRSWHFQIKYTNHSEWEDSALSTNNTLFSYHAGDQMVILVNIDESRCYVNAAFRLHEVSCNDNEATSSSRQRRPTLTQSTTKEPTNNAALQTLNVPNASTNKGGVKNKKKKSKKHYNQRRHPQNNIFAPRRTIHAATHLNKSMAISANVDRGGCSGNGGAGMSSSSAQQKFPRPPPRQSLLSTASTNSYRIPRPRSPRSNSVVIAAHDRDHHQTSAQHVQQSPSAQSSRDRSATLNHAHAHAQVARDRLRSFSPKKKLQLNMDRNTTNNSEDVLCLLRKDSARIEQLEKQIDSLECDNKTLLAKIQEISLAAPQRASMTSSLATNRDDEMDRTWLKQKIEKMEKHIDKQWLKNAGFPINADEYDFKQIVNGCFTLLHQMAKQLQTKEEQFENVSNKMVTLKKENREHKKNLSLLEITIERQKSMLEDLKRQKPTDNYLEHQIKDREKKIAVLKENLRKTERESRDQKSQYQECDKKMSDLQGQKLKLEAHVNSVAKEMRQLKNEYVNVSEQFVSSKAENAKLVRDIRKLRYCLAETNGKVLSLMQTINYSNKVVQRLAYAMDGDEETDHHDRDRTKHAADHDDDDHSLSLTMTYSKGTVTRMPHDDTDDPIDTENLGTNFV